MARAMGIIAVEGDNIKIEGVNNHRPIHTVAFMGRYNLVDFPLSNLSNSGIDNIHVYIKSKPRTVFEHIGTGRQYNINSKHGRIRIMYGEQEISSQIYNTDVQSYLQNIQYISEENAEYVVIVPSHFTYVQNLSEILDEHIESKADITILYKSTHQAKHSFMGCDILKFVKGKRLMGMDINRGQRKDRDISLETYVMKKSLFMHLLRKAHETSPIYWLRDIISESVENLDIRGYALKTNAFAMTDLRSYFDNSMKMLNVYSTKLFNETWPIFTRTSDSPPSVYGKNSKVSNSLIANGSVIDGEVKNCIIGRDVEILEGTKIENCIVMSHTHIGKNKELKGLVVDKYVRIEKIDRLLAEEDDIIYISRNDHI